MAGFEGIRWAPSQLVHDLRQRRSEMRAFDDRTPAVSRSVHYGLGLAFEGIRFFVRREREELRAVFVNLDHNLERFRRSIAFNLSDEQQEWVPAADELRRLLVAFLNHPEQRPFIREMAQAGAQGYLRPFTVAEEPSIGVTFPTQPTIRIVAARYDAYLGEPFSGVVVPFLVRASRANGTGCLKLGGNYLMSLKAIQAARRIKPGAASALFLDDRPDAPLAERTVTEWDTSGALIALKSGTVIRIPDSPLILPSVTVRGVTAILRDEGVEVVERDVTYGELLDRARAGEIVTVCAVGTAGILNRCHELWLADSEGRPIAQTSLDAAHPLAGALTAARTRYWDVYRGDSEAPTGMGPVESHAVCSA